jgi:predicted nuclease of predicted toxin-antitoxin system
VKVLFDECVPWPLQALLPDHECRTAQQMKWKRIKNGELLALAELQFDVFLTCDQNLGYQQNLTGRRIAILELSTNKLRQLIAAAQVIHEAVAGMERGEFRRLHIPDEPS